MNVVNEQIIHSCFSSSFYCYSCTLMSTSTTVEGSHLAWWCCFPSAPAVRRQREGGDDPFVRNLPVCQNLTAKWRRREHHGHSCRSYNAPSHLPVLHSFSGGSFAVADSDQVIPNQHNETQTNRTARRTSQLNNPVDTRYPLLSHLRGALLVCSSFNLARVLITIQIHGTIAIWHVGCRPFVDSGFLPYF